ncbi:hypothetical protein D3C84_928560 [compost metagenome]
MQLVFICLTDQVQHGAVLRVLGGANAALGFVQHQITRCASVLKHLIIDLDAAEFAHFQARVTDAIAVHTHPSLGQQ